MEATGTESPPERRLSILLLVVAAHQRMGQLVDRELAADGVAAADYALLSLVGARGPARLTEVAAELGMPLTTASDAVRRLEARGHVRREPNPDDGRSVLVELTEAGDAEWRRGKADSNPLLDQLRDTVAKAEAQLAKAQAGGNPGKIAEAEAAVAARREWLAEAERSVRR